MAIAFDATTDPGTHVGAGSSQTVAFTCTGTNRYLLVAVVLQGSQTCTGVTYNGVAMTQIQSISTAAIAAGETCYIFGLANPASGANNILASYSGAATNLVGASSFTGVKQTTTPEASNTNSGNSSAATVAVTTLTNNAWLIGFARQAGGTATAGTNTTLRQTADTDMMDTNGPDTPAGSFSLNWTPNTSKQWAALAASIPPIVTSTLGGAFLINMV